MMKRYAEIYPSPEGSTATQLTRRYVTAFGVEASIEDLRESSGYSQDEIWLFSVEMFNRELKKFNFKTASENAERKAAIEKAQREAKAKRKT